MQAPTCNEIPNTGFLRLKQILGGKNTPAILPISRTAWFLGVKEGRFPEGIKLSEKIVVYPVSEIKALLERIEKCRGDNQLPSAK